MCIYIYIYTYIDILFLVREASCDTRFAIKARLSFIIPWNIAGPVAVYLPGMGWHTIQYPPGSPDHMPVTHDFIPEDDVSSEEGHNQVKAVRCRI